MEGLAQIAHHYEYFILDIWGVLHDGVQPYEYTIETLSFLKAHNKEVILLSNTPRPSSITFQGLTKMGIPLNQNQIITSGDMVRDFLTNKTTFSLDLPRGPFYHLGSDRNQDILQDLSVETTSTLEGAAFVLLTSYRDVGEENDAEILNTLSEAYEKKLSIICANPDVEAQHGNTKRLCAGYFARLYEQMGGKVIYFGKPHTLAYSYVFEKLKEKGFTDKSKFLMVGDTYHTDIKGATNAEIDALLIGTGNGSNPLPEGHAAPRWSCTSFKW